MYLSSRVNDSPIAGRLKYFLSDWKRITDYPNMLNIISDMTTEFDDIPSKQQKILFPCLFDKGKPKIMENKILNSWLKQLFLKHFLMFCIKLSVLFFFIQRKLVICK